jgi:TonB family protein
LRIWPSNQPPAKDGRGGEEGAAHPDTECFLAPIPEWTAYDVAPAPATSVKPDYPEFAKDAQIQGTVVLSLFIDSLGRICSLKILKGITGLNEAAVGAVKKWTFTPDGSHFPRSSIITRLSRTFTGTRLPIV